MALNSSASWPPAMMTRRARPASGATSNGVHRPGHFGGEYALDILIAEGLGRGDHQISGLTGEAGGVGLVGQPGGQAGNEPAGADSLGQNIGVEEVLLHELAESGGELILALDDQRGVRYRQAQGTAEQSRHREPVRDAADHGRLGAGLHVVEESPVAPATVTATNTAVTPARRAVARRRAAASRRARSSTDSRSSVDAGAADIGAAGSIWQPPVSPRRGRVGRVVRSARQS